MTPRVPPLPVGERNEKQAELLAGVTMPGAESMNIFATLVRHPRLFGRWLPFGGVLLSGSLPARDRELLILRTAHHTGAAYEWHHHLRIGREAGLTDEEMERVREERESGDWSDDDALLLRAADELFGGSRIAEDTWDALAARYDDQQLIEVPMVVGHYTLLAYTLNSLGVEVEA